MLLQDPLRDWKVKVEIDEVRPNAGSQGGLANHRKTLVDAQNVCIGKLER